MWYDMIHKPVFIHVFGCLDADHRGDKLGEKVGSWALSIPTVQKWDVS